VATRSDIDDFPHDRVFLGAARDDNAVPTLKTATPQTAT